MIKLTHVSKQYGNNRVLNEVSLTFDTGKVYGIVGANGAGKTTLFRCIAGLELYDGTIHSDKTPLKNHLGLLLTEPYFFAKITGLEYLQLLCTARNKKLQDIDNKNIFDLPLNQYASTYSTGMKKKLALSALLLQENDYFILDEPFNGLDIQSNILVTEIILKLKSLGKTILISSHIFSTLHDTCDEIHFFETGQPVRTIQKSDFHILEQEMREKTIGNSIDLMNIK